MAFKDYFLNWVSIGWVGVILIIVILFKTGFKPYAIKAGDFEVSFEQKAKDLGVYNTPEFKNLKNLNESDLKLFLIMGGEDAKFYTFKNSAVNGVAERIQWAKLQTDSLIRAKFIGKDTTMLFPTAVGEKLHKALIQSIYSELIKIKD